MFWNLLVRLQEFLSTAPATQCIAIADSDTESPTFSIDKINDDTQILIDLGGCNIRAPTVIRAYSPFQIEIDSDILLNPEDIAEIETYLPYALLPYFAKKYGKCFAISHFAQTLDGRIAAASGDSKWIGNAENLTHAHKMRALCDAILIGANTLNVDQPRLTVRRVTGQQPVRIVVGGCPTVGTPAEQDGSPILHFVAKTGKDSDDTIELDRMHGSFDCAQILNSLFCRNINSVYIEGGSITTSLFMQGNALDQVQVHISPKVLGSGTTGFQFDGATEMSEALSFNNPRFKTMGDHIMFIGELPK